MLTAKDLDAIDKLIQKRNLESEKRLEKKILDNKGYLLKTINFLERVDWLEKSSGLS